MRRDFHDPWEPEDIFDREEAARRRADREAAIARNNEIIEQEAAQEAQRKEDFRLFALRVNGDQVTAQYLAAGVEPLEVNDEGVPRTSLSLLLSIGWTIVEISGLKKLVAPPARPAPRRREDYHGEGS